MKRTQMEAFGGTSAPSSMWSVGSEQANNSLSTFDDADDDYDLRSGPLWGEIEAVARSSTGLSLKAQKAAQSSKIDRVSLAVATHPSNLLFHEGGLQRQQPVPIDSTGTASSSLQSLPSIIDNNSSFSGLLQGDFGPSSASIKSPSPSFAQKELGMNEKSADNNNKEEEQEEELEIPCTSLPFSFKPNSSSSSKPKDSVLATKRRKITGTPENVIEFPKEPISQHIIRLLQHQSYLYDLLGDDEQGGQAAPKNIQKLLPLPDAESIPGCPLLLPIRGNGKKTDSLNINQMLYPRPNVPPKIVPIAAYQALRKCIAIVGASLGFSVIEADAEEVLAEVLSNKIRESGRQLKILTNRRAEGRECGFKTPFSHWLNLQGITLNTLRLFHVRRLQNYRDKVLRETKELRREVVQHFSLTDERPELLLLAAEEKEDSAAGSFHHHYQNHHPADNTTSSRLNHQNQQQGGSIAIIMNNSNSNNLLLNLRHAEKLISSAADSVLRKMGLFIAPNPKQQLAAAGDGKLMMSRDSIKSTSADVDANHPNNRRENSSNSMGFNRQDRLVAAAVESVLLKMRSSSTSADIDVNHPNHSKENSSNSKEINHQDGLVAAAVESVLLKMRSSSTSADVDVYYPNNRKENSSNREEINHQDGLVSAAVKSALLKIRSSSSSSSNVEVKQHQSSSNQANSGINKANSTSSKGILRPQAELISKSVDAVLAKYNCLSHQTISHPNPISGSVESTASSVSFISNPNKLRRKAELISAVVDTVVARTLKTESSGTAQNRRRTTTSASNNNSSNKNNSERRPPPSILKSSTSSQLPMKHSITSQLKTERNDEGSTIVDD